MAIAFFEASQVAYQEIQEYLMWYGVGCRTVEFKANISRIFYT